MLDCGMNSTTDFSPANFVRNAWQVRQLDYLIVSHPHLDHIRDISNVVTLEPRALRRRHIEIDKLVTGEYEEYENLIREYVSFEQRYDQPITGTANPGTWEVKFHNFETQADDENINNMGVATFVNYGNFTLLHPGDLEQEGWAELLEDREFITDLRNTNFLVASHHGRESGFSGSIFRYFTPKLTIVSDGRYQDTSATSRYSAIAQGWNVYDSGTTRYERRKVVTTRSDGRIHIRVEITDSSTTVHVDRKPVVK